MNWSVYSEFVGDVFGAPLAIEGLAAFMLESTFLGLWIFGWDRLSQARPPRLRSGSSRSAPGCRRSSSSWPTRGCSGPVGSDVVDGRAELTSIWDLLTNRLAIWAYGHVVMVGLDDGGGRDLRRRVLAPPPRSERGSLPQGGEARADRRRPDLGGQPLVGQPPRHRHHRLPADEDRRHRGALGHGAAARRSRSSRSAASRRRTRRRASTSRSRSSSRSSPPGPSTARSRASTRFSSSRSASTGAGNYKPPVETTYWAMRVMAYLGSLVFLVLGVGALLWWRKRFETSRWFLWVGVCTVPLPYLAALAGWVLTEVGTAAVDRLGPAQDRRMRTRRACRARRSR